MATPHTKVGFIDRPYRSPEGFSALNKDAAIDDLRRALDRTNERINVLNNRVAELESQLFDQTFYVYPS